MPYYTNTEDLTAGTTARGTDVDTKFEAVETAFASAETDIDRAIKMPSGDEELPTNAVDRADRVIGFDAAGAVSLIAITGLSVTPSTVFGQDLGTTDSPTFAGLTVNGTITGTGAISVTAKGTFQELTISKAGGPDWVSYNSSAAANAGKFIATHQSGGDWVWGHTSDDEATTVEYFRFDRSETALSMTGGILIDQITPITTNLTLASGDLILSSGNVQATGFTDGTGGIFCNTQSIADDATATFNVPERGIYFLSFDATQEDAYAVLAGERTNALDILAGGTGNLSVNASSNPDVDTNVNAWKSANGVLSIKNRLGATVTFNVVGVGAFTPS